MKKGDVFNIADQTSTKYKILDSIGKVFGIVEQLADSESGLKEWQFLRNWGTFTLEEKHKKYEKFISHELNVFLYFKDPDYF